METPRVFYLLPERRNVSERTTPHRALPTDLIRKSPPPPPPPSLAQEWQMMVPDLSGKKQTNEKKNKKKQKLRRRTVKQNGFQVVSPPQDDVL